MSCLICVNFVANLAVCRLEFSMSAAMQTSNFEAVEWVPCMAIVNGACCSCQQDGVHGEFCGVRLSEALVAYVLVLLKGDRCKVKAAPYSKNIRQSNRADKSRTEEAHQACPYLIGYLYRVTDKGISQNVRLLGWVTSKHCSIVQDRMCLMFWSSIRFPYSLIILVMFVAID